MWRFSLVYFPLIRPARPLSIVHAHDDHIWCDCDATHREMYRMAFEIGFGLNNECDQFESETSNSQVSGFPNVGYFDLDIRNNHTGQLLSLTLIQFPHEITVFGRHLHFGLRTKYNQRALTNVNHQFIYIDYVYTNVRLESSSQWKLKKQRKNSILM